MRRDRLFREGVSTAWGKRSVPTAVRRAAASKGSVREDGSLPQAELISAEKVQFRADKMRILFTPSRDRRAATGRRTTWCAFLQGPLDAHCSQFRDMLHPGRVIILPAELRT